MQGKRVLDAEGFVRSAGGLVFDESGRVLLVERADGGYGLPKGHVEPGETAEQAAVRELREETGYVVEIVKHLDTVSRHSTGDSAREAMKRIDMFAVRIVGGTLGSNEEHPLWVPVAQAVTGMYHPEEMIFLQTHRPVPDADA